MAMANFLELQKKSSFWWRDILKLLGKYKGMAQVNISNGTTCLLWNDLWEGELGKYPVRNSLNCYRLQKIST